MGNLDHHGLCPPALLTSLIRDKHIGKQIVPIIPDEARTFGMEGLFRQLGIYAPFGQLYEPQDGETVACTGRMSRARS